MSGSSLQFSVLMIVLYTLSGITVTSAPVSILNLDSLPFTFTVVIQAPVIVPTHTRVMSYSFTLMTFRRCCWARSSIMRRFLSASGTAVSCLFSSGDEGFAFQAFVGSCNVCRSVHVARVTAYAQTRFSVE